MDKQLLTKLVKEILMEHLRVDVYHRQANNDRINLEVDVSLFWDDEKIHEDTY